LLWEAFGAQPWREMTTKQRLSAEAVEGDWGNCPALRLLPLLLAVAVLLLMMSTRLQAAFTEPRLALMRVTAYRSTSGTNTLTLEGSFSYADTVQLALPLNVVVTQGQLTARFDLAGNVFTSTGGPEEPGAGPGVISFAPREIVLVLPAGFAPGTATAQVVANYERQPISSNRLSFTL
jgi:hypothetical protein